MISAHFQWSWLVVASEDSEGVFSQEFNNKLSKYELECWS